MVSFWRENETNWPVIVPEINSMREEVGPDGLLACRGIHVGLSYS